MIKSSLLRWPSLAFSNIWYIAELHYDQGLLLLLYNYGCCCVSCCKSLLCVFAVYICSSSLLRVSGAAAASSWLLLNISDLRSQLGCNLSLMLLLLLLHVFDAEKTLAAVAYLRLLCYIYGCCRVSLRDCLHIFRLDLGIFMQHWFDVYQLCLWVGIPRQ